MSAENIKPNILLIMCDQLRADVLGCYGNRLVKTPNIDRIAKSGICFDRAYSQTPVCMPARHALISGKNAFELGMMENTRRRKEIRNPMPKLIRDAGYFTCAVGKMHFTPVREHFGFDRMYLSEEIPAHIVNDDYLEFLISKGYGHVTEPHGRRSEYYYVPQDSELPEDIHTTAWTGRKTCEMIRKNRSLPHFIFSSFIKPHPPFDPCKPFNTMYDENEVPLPERREYERFHYDPVIDHQNDYKVNGIDTVDDAKTRKIRAYYYACVSQVDKYIGEILDTLEEYGLYDNTLIVLTTDHGEMLGDHYAFGKRMYYEQSTRIPFIVSWPEMLPQGVRRDHFVIMQDILPTLVKAAGGNVPEDIAGNDIMGICKDTGLPWRDHIIGEYGKNEYTKFMYRWDDWKYIYIARGGIEVLYNLKQDPGEFNNVAAEHLELCSMCRKKLADYYKKYGFYEVLDGDSLIKLEPQELKKTGYLNQRPSWPAFLSDYTD